MNAPHQPWATLHKTPIHFEARPAFGKRSALKRTLLILLAAPLSLVAAEPGPSAPSPSGVGLLLAPEGAKTITIQMSASEEAGPRQTGYLARRGPEPLPPATALPDAIKEQYSGKDFSAFEIGVLPDGTRYLVVLNEDKSIKFLNQGMSAMCYARIYRLGPEKGSKPEIVREGFQSYGSDLTIPVEIQSPGIGATKLKRLRTEIGYNISSFHDGEPQVYGGRGPGLQVSGSQMTPEGKLTLTLEVPETMAVTPDMQASIRFEPMTPGLPERSAAGKITDLLTLGSARLAVTSIEPDFSKATLAIMGGSLEETLKQQLQRGARMPPFSQVDLLTRKTVTREELLARGKGSAPIIFVFGDLASPASRNPYGPPAGPAMGPVLPLPTAEVADQLGLETQPKPLIVFVTRQIGLDYLYSELRNKTPDYVVLADFADPLRTTFRMPQPNPGGWFGPSYPGNREPSLRQLFNLPERTVSLVVFEGSGKVTYVKADASAEFLVSLAEARAATK